MVKIWEVAVVPEQYTLSTLSGSGVVRADAHVAGNRLVCGQRLGGTALCDPGQLTSIPDAAAIRLDGAFDTEPVALRITAPPWARTRNWLWLEEVKSAMTKSVQTKVPS
jgi:hypothetical protein